VARGDISGAWSGAAPTIQMPFEHRKVAHIAVEGMGFGLVWRFAFSGGRERASRPPRNAFAHPAFARIVVFPYFLPLPPASW